METLIPTAETSPLSGGLRSVFVGTRKLLFAAVAKLARGLVSAVFCLGEVLLLVEERPIVQSIQRRRSMKAARMAGWPTAHHPSKTDNRHERLLRSE